MNTELINDLTEQYNIFQEEIEKFNDKGVGAAGTRARKQAQELKNLLQDLRKEILEERNKG